MNLDDIQKENARLNLENSKLKEKIAELEEKLNKITCGGRPSKFTDQEKETMKMYRLQGKSIRTIAEIFNCSTGLVHKIVSE